MCKKPYLLLASWFLVFLPHAPPASGQSEWAIVREGAPEQPGFSPVLRSVAHGNGHFLAVGLWGSILASPDGSSWIEIPRESTQPFSGVVYGADKFVIVGGDGPVHTSADGEQWTEQPVDFDASLNAVAHGNGQFVAVGKSVIEGDNDDEVSEGGFVAMSLDGEDWTEEASAVLKPDETGSSVLRAVAYGNERFVAVGDGGIILTAADGSDWTEMESKTEADLRGVAYADGRFVAVGDDGTILHSTDGQSWTTASSGSEARFADVVFGNGEIVAVGYEAGSGMLAFSIDGDTWTTTPAGIHAPLTGAAFGDGVFVAVGVNGMIARSPAEMHWSETGPVQVPAHLWGLAYGDEGIVAVGEGPSAWFSEDGTDWENVSSGIPAGISLWDIAYGNDLYAAAGDRGTIVTSTDGRTWRAQLKADATDDVSGRFGGITYGNGLFVAVGDAGIIASSSDGLDWTVGKLEVPYHLWSVAAGPERFVAVGEARSGSWPSERPGPSWKAAMARTGRPGARASTEYGNMTWI